MKTRLLFLAPLAVALMAPAALAQDDPRKAQAEAVYQQAWALHDAHKEDEALAKLREAYAIFPTANVLFSIAREEQLLGQKVQALRDYRASLKDPLLTLKFQETARQHIAELEQSTARLKIAAPPGVTVSVDATVVDTSGVVDVEPGSHNVTGSREGKACVPQHATAPTGAVVDVTLTFASSASTEPPTTETRTKVFPPPTGAIVLGGVGLVGLGLGVGFGLASSSAKSDLESRSCALVRDPACSDSKSAGQRDATISWISYVAGGVLVAGGVVWWIAAPRKETVSVGLVPSVGPGMSGATLRGTF